MIKPHRSHPLYIFFLLHRISGLALALFLPVHFYVLSLAIADPASLDAFLELTDLTSVKIAEAVLVFLLAAHLFGGLRLMAMEWLPWTDWQKTLAAASLVLGLLTACLFLLSVF